MCTVIKDKGLLKHIDKLGQKCSLPSLNSPAQRISVEVSKPSLLKRMAMKLVGATCSASATGGSMATALAKAGLAVPLLIVKPDSLGEAALEMSGNDGRGESGGGVTDEDEEEDGLGSSALSFRPIKAAVEVRTAGSTMYTSCIARQCILVHPNYSSI